MQENPTKGTPPSVILNDDEEKESSSSTNPTDKPPATVELKPNVSELQTPNHAVSHKEGESADSITPVVSPSSTSLDSYPSSNNPAQIQEESQRPDIIG